MEESHIKRDDIAVVLCGAAGQGVQTVEHLMTSLLTRAGYNLFSTKEYMSRVRGGSNSTLLRVASRPVNAYVERIDLFFPLNPGDIGHCSRRIGDETIIIGEKSILTAGGANAGYAIVDVPFTDIAKEIGGAIFANIVVVGFMAALFSLDRGEVGDYLKKRFKAKGGDVVDKNLIALERGYALAESPAIRDRIAIDVQRDDSVKDKIVVNGAEAVGMGALAGGCSFISSYPMTPSTGVLTFLAQQGEAFSVIAEQAEDEIAAINMAIGAWYAGARAMVSTSGGGFALMTEGVSLAGIIESPMVIHLAQRPGPGTGLPTRTEQGDLDLALYAGHGEFPRIIYAPGDLEEAFSLAQKAFSMADRYQVPVFILTDQYLVDSYYPIPAFDPAASPMVSTVVTTTAEYRRYEHSRNGVSPRGVPGNGEGLVVVDSDEHTEEGHITEDHEVRVGMVEKRLKKGDSLLKEALPPTVIGDRNAATLVICWGSTRTVVEEAVASLAREDMAVVHFSQVYPVHPDATALLEGARTRVVIEGNATGQFERILCTKSGVCFPHVLRKYNGLQFSVEEVADYLSAIAQ